MFGFGSPKREYEQSMDTAFALFEAERYAEAEVEVRRALKAAEKAFGADSGEVYEALSALNLLLKVLGEPEEATSLARRRIEVATLVFGPHSEELAESLFELGSLLDALDEGDESVLVLNRFLEVARSCPDVDELDQAAALVLLGERARDESRIDEAETLLADAIAIARRRHAETSTVALEAQRHLARLREMQDRPTEAEAMLRDAVARAEADADTDPDDIADLLNALGSPLVTLERFAEAVAVQRRAIELKTEALGEEHPTVAIFWRNLAGLYEDMGEGALSDEAWERAIDTTTAVFGPDGWTTLDVLSDHGASLYRRGEVERAEQVVIRVVDGLRAAEEPDDEMLGANVNRLASIYTDLGRHADAEALYREALGLANAVHGPRSEPAHVCWSNLGSSLIELERFEEAAAALRTSVDIAADLEDDADLGLPATYERLAYALIELEQEADAEAAYRAAIESAQRTGSTFSLDYAVVLRGLGLLLVASDRVPDGAGLLRSAVQVMEMAGGDPFGLALTHSMVSAADFQLEHYADAEASARSALLLLEGDGAPDPELLAEVLVRLGDALVAQDRGEDAVDAFERAVQAARLATDDGHTLQWTRYSYAGALLELERFEDAEPILRDALAAVADGVEVPADVEATMLAGLAKVLHRTGRLADAEVHIRAAIDQEEALLGVDHGELAYPYTRLAEILSELGRRDEALDAADRAERLALGLSADDEDGSELRERLERVRG